jgi:two-component system sensor histidine kinase VanS
VQIWVKPGVAPPARILIALPSQPAMDRPGQVGPRRRRINVLGDEDLVLTGADRSTGGGGGKEPGDLLLVSPVHATILPALGLWSAHLPRCSGLRLDPFRREVYRDGRYVALTRKQFAVLEVLVAAEGGVVSAEWLLERAWDENADPFTNAVRITVSALRKRLGEPGISPPWPASATASTQQPTPDVKAMTVDRAPGLSVRLKLTLSYASFLMLASALLLAAVWVFLLRYVPEVIDTTARTRRLSAPGLFVPNRSDLLRAFAPKAAAALAFLLVFGVLGGWILAGRMLAPLARITNATRLAADGSLSHRIRLEGRKDEFRELADAFDTMLARLEAHVAQQQRFAANASHELRTPLAITQTLLDVARNDPSRDPGELVERLHFVNTRAIDLTEALLVPSRADQRSFTREHVDLSLIVEEATETLLPLAEKRGLTIETSGDMTPTIGSHALLQQMTTNLMHNAIVHT